MSVGDPQKSTACLFKFMAMSTLVLMSTLCVTSKRDEEISHDERPKRVLIISIYVTDYWWGFYLGWEPISSRSKPIAKRCLSFDFTSPTADVKVTGAP